MDKEWFILIDNRREGPYTKQDLKYDLRITPDTLVWTEGFKDWIAIRYIAELKDLFKDESTTPQPLHEDNKNNPISGLPEQDTLTIQNDPPQIFLWLIVLILIIIIIFYRAQFI